MGLNANNVKAPSKPKKVLEPDVYPVRLVQVIDLGLQPQNAFQGNAKPPCQEISLTYEFCDEFMQDDDGNDIPDKPRWLSESIPFYPLFADKAKSTQRYLAFDASQAFGGDFIKCLGLPANLTVVNNAKGDLVYNNVGNLAAMSTKRIAQCPPLVNAPVSFDLDAPNMEVFNKLPKWLQDKIKSNLNFQGSKLQAALNGKPVKEEPPEKDPDADVPY